MWKSFWITEITIEFTWESGYFWVHPTVRRAKLPPCMKSDWPTWQTNYRSKWILIDSHTNNQQGKAVCVKFRLILAGISRIPKGGHVWSRVERHGHFFCVSFVAGRDRCFSGKNRKNIEMREKMRIQWAKCPSRS